MGEFLGVDTRIRGATRSFRGLDGASAPQFAPRRRHVSAECHSPPPASFPSPEVPPPLHGRSFNSLSHFVIALRIRVAKSPIWAMFLDFFAAIVAYQMAHEPGGR